ncbi:MAG TPA: thrombospondin type 3 repeat-containing protein [Nannocystis sp.]
MQTRLLTPLLVSLLLAAPLACGDDKGGAETETATGTSTSTTGETSTGETPTTTGEDPSTSTTSTSGETPTTTDPTTTGAGDQDMDGVIDGVDNCPSDANPNQLDFDGNAVGNVCDEPLSFTIADGVPPEFNKLDTTATANKTLECMFPVSLVVLNGEVQVTLDDAGIARVYAAKLNFADTPELTCDLTLVKVKLKITEFFADGPDPFLVGFPFTLPDHDNGTITGNTDMPHTILVSGLINVTESSNEDLAPTGESALEMVPGAFPNALASVVNKGEQVSMLFTDSNSVLFEQTTMSGIKITLTGLNGTLRLKR